MTNSVQSNSSHEESPEEKEENSRRHQENSRSTNNETKNRLSYAFGSWGSRLRSTLGGVGATDEVDDESGGSDSDESASSVDSYEDEDEIEENEESPIDDEDSGENDEENEDFFDEGTSSIFDDVDDNHQQDNAMDTVSNRPAADVGGSSFVDDGSSTFVMDEDESLFGGVRDISSVSLQRQQRIGFAPPTTATDVNEFVTDAVRTRLTLAERTAKVRAAASNTHGTQTLSRTRTKATSSSPPKARRLRQQQRTAFGRNYSKQKNTQTNSTPPPSLEPQVGRLERFELFSTAQCYYLVACDKSGLWYRVLKMDRTLIERPTTPTQSSASPSPSPPNTAGRNQNYPAASSSASDGINPVASAPSPSLSDWDAGTVMTSATGKATVGNNIGPVATTAAALRSAAPPHSSLLQQPSSRTSNFEPLSNSPLSSHGTTTTTTPTTYEFRPLSEFCTEDPTVYGPNEIRDMLDMIHYGNHGGPIANHESNDVKHLMASTNKDGKHSSNNSGNVRGLNDGYPPQTLGPKDAAASTTGIGSTNTTSGNNSNGDGLKPIAKAYGVVGFTRFLDCYYLTLITKCTKVGSIGGNDIYSIQSTETFPLKPAERSPSSASVTDNPSSTDPSSMLLSMWNRGKRSVGLGLTNREIAELRYQGLYQFVDLTKNFFFSYTYDLTRSLQENFLSMTSRPFPPPPFKDMYAWNFFLTRELEECTSSLTAFHWVMPIVHGAFMQRKLNDYGRSLNLTLLARRSRHFAGTRYLKRGSSDRGKVANDVEHEQILHDETTSASSGAFSSFLQVRGSIPTYWTQESSVTMPKPPIVLNRVDPTYHATQLHFEDLLQRYGSPIVVVDLVKQSEKREREVIVGDEFRHAIDYLNCHMDDPHKILYCALDYSHISKHRNLNVSTSINETATWSVNQTGFFCSAPRWKILPGGRVEPFGEGPDGRNRDAALRLTHQLGIPVFPMEQKGVLRTNCIDCLDRTNVAQFSAGVDALGQQLVVMGIRNTAKLDPSSNIVRILIDMYVEIGDFIALQYGGSEAHKKVSTAGSTSNIPGPMGKHKELLTSIRRYYSNAFTDRLKQDAMNLFLGYFVPSCHTVPLWEMENDYYLHNFHVKEGKGSVHSMKHYQGMFGVDWSDDEDDDYDDVSPQITTRKSQFSSMARGAQRKTTRTSSSGTTDVNSRRIDRVRNRCRAQNDALSEWWKRAIQSYIQQRMWMTLGQSPLESLLPLRFERLYQPDKLAQFDKFFARDWAKPVRLSHTAQHSHSVDDDTEVLLLHRKQSSPSKGIKGNGAQQMSPSPREGIGRNNRNGDSVANRELDGTSMGRDEGATAQDNGKNEENPHADLKSFVYQNGYMPSDKQRHLPKFLESHNRRHYWLQDNRKIPSNESDPRGQPEAEEYRSFGYTPFLGDLSRKETPYEEYVKYANKRQIKQQSHSLSQDYRSSARKEFTELLRETSLDSDDVEGIQKLAESAHIGSIIRKGPYRGLRHAQSAIEVNTVIQEQLNALGNMHRRGEVVGSNFFRGIDEELHGRNLGTDGVKDAVHGGWQRCGKVERAYNEILDSSSLGCRRSDITCERSMRLYASFYDESTSISELDAAFMRRERLRVGPRGNQTPGEKANRAIGKKSFSSVARKYGIQVSPYTAEKLSRHEPSLFSFENKRSAPGGFEQINEDLFARRDNRFMVFNGAAVDTWNGIPEPITKVRGIEEDVLVGRS